MTVLRFPTPEPDEPEGPRCRTCGFPLIIRDGEPMRDLCFCCARNIPLPLHPIDPPPCPQCGGRGVVEMPVVRNDKTYTVVGTKTEPCAACLGRREG